MKEPLFLLRLERILNPLFSYMTQRRICQNEFPYFITTNIRERFWFFDNKEYTLLFYKIVIKACKKKDFILYAFGILADHVHLLVKKRDIAGRDTRAVNSLFNTTRVSAPALGGESNNISDLLYTIKSFFSYEMRKKYGLDFKFWQSRYNFRIIDNEKRLYNTIQYIKYNYQKHGLSEKYSRYPYLYIGEKQINDLFF